MTIFSFVFKRTLKGKIDILMLFLLPVMTVFISAETWMPIPLGFQLYGILVMIMSSKICRTMMIDREKKVVLRISAAPITHLRYLGENLLAYSMILSFVNFIVVGLGVFRYGVGIISPFKMLMLLSAFSAASIGLSIAWYALFQHAETAYSILGGIQIAIAMLGGMLWPFEIMPVFIQKSIRLLPTYWYALGMRQIAYKDYQGNLLLTIGILFLFSAVYILIGSRKRLG